MEHLLCIRSLENRDKTVLGEGRRGPHVHKTIWELRWGAAGQKWWAGKIPQSWCQSWVFKLGKHTVGRRSSKPKPERAWHVWETGIPHGWNIGWWEIRLERRRGMRSWTAFSMHAKEVALYPEVHKQKKTVQWGDMLRSLCQENRSGHNSKRDWRGSSGGGGGCGETGVIAYWIVLVYQLLNPWPEYGTDETDLRKTMAFTTITWCLNQYLKREFVKNTL